MSNIIGGEFSINYNDISITAPSIENLYSCGRAALYAILLDAKESSSSRILVPDYICDSVIQTVIDAGYQYELYHINKTLEPDLDTIFNNTGKFNLILLVNYFGITDLSESINSIKSKNPNSIIIVDNVQNAFGFLSGCEGDYSFTSYRKWFALPDGADAKCRDKHNLINYNSENTFYEYKLAGNFLKACDEYINSSIYLDLIDNGEALLDTSYRCKCSDYSSMRFSLIDKASIMERRIQNSLYLHRGLSDLGIRHLYSDVSIPMFVPIFVEDRNSLRKMFFKDEIFIPVHWINKRIDLSQHNDLYETELSLICDQRYNISDMERILDTVKKWK